MSTSGSLRRRFGLVVHPSAGKCGIEVKVIPITPVHEVAKQIAKAILIVGAGHALKLAQGGGSP